MSVYLFLGPSLPAEEARRELEAVWLPPVSQGDVYCVALSRPRAIGIVDGYFEQVPAVWHKEILWALSEGIAVYGAASMGALRAAELHPFGMVGIGWIFEAFRDGILEDDDEVAVAHGPAETGYRPLSEPLVNIRRTLERAASAGVIGSEARAALERLAKGLHYPQRSFPEVCRLAAAAGLPAVELDALQRWLPVGRVDQKRQDALDMLRLMREHLTAGHRPQPAPFRLAHTVFWDRLRNAVGAPAPGVAGGWAGSEAVLDEARLEGDTYVRVRQAALLRHLLLAEADRRGIEAGAEAEQACVDAFRQLHRLGGGDEALVAWLERSGLDGAGFRVLMREEARLAAAAGQLSLEAVRRLPDVLRVTGDSRRLRARTAEKEEVLRQRGLAQADLQTLGLTEEGLLAWYFARHGSPMPQDTAAYVRAAGFADRERFLEALRREFAYVRDKEAGGGPDATA